MKYTREFLAGDTVGIEEEHVLEIEKLSFPRKDRILGFLKGASGGIESHPLGACLEYLPDHADRGFQTFEEGIFWASITASATLYPSIYPTSRRGGLRGAGGISTDAKIAVNMQRGFCLKNRSAAVVPSGRVRKKL